MNLNYVNIDLVNMEQSIVYSQFPKDIVTFDVSGTIIKTTLITINNRPGTMLNRMFANVLAIKVQPDGSIFIDEDPIIFRLVLQAHRKPTVSLPSIFRGITEELYKQIIDYWGLVPIEPIEQPEPFVLDHKHIQISIIVKFITSIKNQTDFINCLLYNDRIAIVTDQDKQIYYGPSESDFVYEFKWLNLVFSNYRGWRFNDTYHVALNQCGLKDIRITGQDMQMFIRCDFDALNTQIIYHIPNNTALHVLTYQQIHTELSEIFIEQYIKKAASYEESCKYYTKIIVSFDENQMITTSFGPVDLYKWFDNIYNSNAALKDIFEKIVAKAGISQITIHGISKTEFILSFN